jgi:hypothetical protein
MISRTSIGGRQLRNRLFSTDEVTKTVVMKGLVDLGIGPSAARDAVSAIWKQLNKKEAPDGWSIYAVVRPTRGGIWTAALCSRKEEGGALQEYKSAKSTDPKAFEQMELPHKPFAVIPISDVFEHVSNRLSELLRSV